MPSTPDRRQADRARQLATRLDADHPAGPEGAGDDCATCAFGLALGAGWAAAHVLAAAQLDEAERWLGGRSPLGFGAQHVKDAVAALQAAGASRVTAGEIADHLLALPRDAARSPLPGRPPAPAPASRLVSRVSLRPAVPSLSCSPLPLPTSSLTCTSANSIGTVREPPDEHGG
jgi:hypothetical protein